MKQSNQQDQAKLVFPDLLGTNLIDDGIILSLRIPENLAYFDGHFDQIPVVPGVAQIQWAVHYARQHLALNLAFSHMESIKFKELLMPGQHLQLELRYLANSRKLEFCFRSETCEYSSGRIYFHDYSV